MANPSSRKSCTVPKCTSTTTKTPEKLFFLIPMDLKIRKKWLSAMRRLDPFGEKSKVYCCEDHFNIENDMENYIKYKLVGGRIKLKKGIVPHKFECQENKDKPERSAVKKHDQIKYFKKLLNKDNIPILDATENPEEILPTRCPDETKLEDPLAFANNDQPLEISGKNKEVKENLKDVGVHKSIRTNAKYFNKMGKIISDPERMSVGTTNNTICSSASFHEMYKHDQYSNNPNKDSDTQNSESEIHIFRNHMQKAALLCISREPQLLLGLPKECYFCINLISETTKCTPRNIMITLKKIRLYQANAILALDFGLGTSTVTKIIRKTVPAVAAFLKSLVYFPPSSVVEMNQPIPFRKNYSQVQSIINCFEIQIEKPNDAVKAALTWSDCNNCNTIKYLMSITPDGLINFISSGYGGGKSDSLIFEDSGILETLPEGSAIFADRGFKNIAHILLQNGHTLIRPPSVSAGVKLTKKQVLQTKTISSLQIHIERSIGRLRGFQFMLPHTCVELKQVDILDSIVISACGIVNLQSSLFKE